MAHVSRRSKKVQCGGVGLLPLEVTKTATLETNENDRATGSYARGVCPGCRKDVRLAKNGKVGKHDDPYEKGEVYSIEISSSKYGRIASLCDILQIDSEVWLDIVLESAIKAATKKIK